MKSNANRFMFRRDYNGHVIRVAAIYIPTMEIWGLMCTADGEGADHIQSTDPWNDARAMMDSALMAITATENKTPSMFFLELAVEERAKSG